jgi:hypothetical protein
MAVKPQVTRPKSLKVKPRPEVPLGFPWGPLNWLSLGAGVLLLVVGYVSLARNSITLAPILLVAGYCVFLPAALLLRGGERAGAPEAGVWPVACETAGQAPGAAPLDAEAPTQG